MQTLQVVGADLGNLPDGGLGLSLLILKGKTELMEESCVGHGGEGAFLGSSPGQVR
jgi:hypothetical protein